MAEKQTFTVVVEGTDEVDAMLRRVREDFGGQAMVPVMRSLTYRCGEEIIDNIKSEGVLGGSRYAPLSVVTEALRASGKGPKAYSLDDLKDRRSPPLQDKRLLLMSFDPDVETGRGAVRRVTPTEATFGSNLERAHLMQVGGSSQFTFGDKEEKRLKSNLSPTKRGRRFRKSKDGKRRQWKRQGKESPHNEDYYKMLGAMRKMDGKSYAVPERPPIPAQWSAWAMQDFERICTDGARKIVDDAAKANGGRAGA